MAKRSFSLAELCRCSNNQLYFEVVQGVTAFANLKGAFGLLTTDGTVLPELEKKGVTLYPKPGLKDRLQQLINEPKGDKIHAYHSVGITMTIFNFSVAEKQKIEVLADNERKDDVRVRMVNADYFGIFDPALITGGDQSADPIILVCPDCFGVLMPFVPNKQAASHHAEDLKHIQKYLERIR